MIYSFLNGRLGNNLFQVAAGASLAKRMGVPYSCSYELQMNLSPSARASAYKSSILKKVELISKVPEGITQFEEPEFSYNALPQEDNISLLGYFQSEKYFDKELVRSLFEIDDETKQYIRNKYGHILNRPDTVSVGIRRGDYLQLGYLYTICEVGYFCRAMKYIGTEKTFLIISDDQEWCRKHFKGDNICFSENESALVDLYLHSMCKHNIISNSSFGWWGAWLNSNPDKIVVYPTPWFQGVYYEKHGVSDLCPETWIPIRALDWFSFLLFKCGILVAYKKMINSLMYTKLYRFTRRLYEFYKKKA